MEQTTTSPSKTILPIQFLRIKQHIRIKINGTMFDKVFLLDDLLKTTEYIIAPSKRKPQLLAQLERFANIFSMRLDEAVLIDAMKEILMPTQKPINEDPTHFLSQHDTFEMLKSFLPEHQQKLFEILTVVLSCPKETTCPPWLLIKGPPSTGKTFLCAKFKSEDTLSVDNLTENSLAPGRPNKEAPEAMGLFEIGNHKNVICNDLAALFSDRQEKVQKFLGFLTNAYGGHFTNMSPGDGLREYETYLTIVLAITPEAANKHWRYITSIGNRFLVYNLTRGKMIIRKKLPPTFEAQICTIIHEQMHDPELPSVTPEIDHEIETFAQQIVDLRSFIYSRPEELEGPDRLYHELLTLMQVRARIYRREVRLEDLVFFREIAINTIPNIEKLRLFADPTCQGHARTFDPKSIIDRIATHGFACGFMESYEDTYTGENNREVHTTKYYFKKPYAEVLADPHKTGSIVKPDPPDQPPEFDEDPH